MLCRKRGQVSLPIKIPQFLEYMLIQQIVKHQLGQILNHQSPDYAEVPNLWLQACLAAVSPESSEGQGRLLKASGKLRLKAKCSVCCGTVSYAAWDPGKCWARFCVQTVNVVHSDVLFGAKGIKVVSSSCKQSLGKVIACCNA